VLNLKEGMAVILLCNLDVRRGLVNGSQGTIVGFTKFEDVEKPRAAQPGEGYDTPSPRGAVLFGDHTHLRVKEIEEYMDTSHHQAWPIVQFVGVKDPVEVYADCTVNTKGDEEPKAVESRTQIPLMAGWAITIHRSQVCRSLQASII
jgi:ATP-dependent DNA helicase PIF1